MGTGKEELTKTMALVNESSRARRMMDSWSGTIQFELQGEAGPFHITVANGRMGLQDGSHENPWMVISGEGDSFAKVASGRLDITHPIAKGQLRVVKGKVLDTIYLSRTILAAFRKG